MLVPGHPRISIDPEICFGKPVIAGTRMRVMDILGALSAGDSIANIVEDFPYVDEEAIYACLAYAAEVTGRPVAIAAE